MNSDEISILLVDDHEIFLDGLASLLSESEEIRIIGTVLNGLEALEKLKAELPDVLITDLSMPEMDGTELVRTVKKEFPDVKILVLSMHDDRETISEIMMSEAEGYLLKNTGKRELIKAIARVHNGSTYYSNRVMEIILERFQEQQKKLEVEAMLTEREIEILTLIGQEKSSKEIGEELNISVRTVDTHRKNLLKKAGTHTVIGLLKYGVKHGLISLSD